MQHVVQTNYREWIETALKPEKWHGDEASCRCPLPDHQDADPSFHANAAKAVWKCHGCNRSGTLRDLAAILGVPPPMLNGAAPRGRTGRPPSKVYQYRDERDTVIFEVVRMDGKKDFRQRHQENGQTVWKLPPAGRGQPYRLPEMQGAAAAGKPVLIVEGEKDADRLGAMGFIATCNAAGAGKWTARHSARLPRGVDVVLFADADDPGIAHVEKVGRSLTKAGKVGAVSVVPPDAMGHVVTEKHGLDVSDWLAADPDRGAAAVQALIAAAVDFATWIPPATGGTSTASDGRPVIMWQEGERLSWTRSAIDALTALPDDERTIYGSPMRTVGTGANLGLLSALQRAAEPEPDARVQTPKGTLQIVEATGAAVLARLDRHVRWMKKPRKDVPRLSDPSLQHAKEIAERYRADTVEPDRPRFRSLSGVVDTPTLRRDGTLIVAPGYDPASALYCDFEENDWQSLIPTKPDREDARAAAALLYDMVKESMFRGDIDRAVWLAFVLTIIGRQYVGGNVPLFGFSANASGSGKGTLVDCATIIATNRGATKWAPVSASRQQDAESEERKRLMAVAISGTRVLCIDNVPAGAPIGTPAMDGCITSGDNSRLGYVQDRVLGETGLTGEVPWTCVLAATGNNLTVRGDMARRMVLCRLETTHPDPEQIKYEHHPDPQGYAREQRTELLCAALTILIAHRRAVENGDPEAVIRPWVNSFGNWSDRIRSAVAWADPAGADPWRANYEVKANMQPDQAEALVFLSAWHEEFGTQQLRAKDIDLFCREDTPDYKPGLAAAVAELDVASPRGHSAINVRSLGVWLGKYADRPGPYVLRKGSARKWYVEKSEAPAPVVTAVEHPAGLVLTPALTDKEFVIVKQFRAINATYEAWGIDVDNAHPAASVVYEYDPPLATCPKGCHTYTEHLDDPQNPAELERWRRNGCPDRRKCLGCETVFEAVPAPCRRLVQVRLETPEETEARLRDTADAVARVRERQAEKAIPYMIALADGTPGGESHPEETETETPLLLPAPANGNPYEDRSTGDGC